MSCHLAKPFGVKETKMEKLRYRSVISSKAIHFVKIVNEGNVCLVKEMFALTLS